MRPATHRRRRRTNLLAFRANRELGRLFHADNVANVRITFKENIGVQGRAGYFDECAPRRTTPHHAAPRRTTPPRMPHLFAYLGFASKSCLRIVSRAPSTRRAPGLHLGAGTESSATSCSTT